MKLSNIFLWIMLFPVMASAQPTESMCKTALQFREYATLGDCYKYGVGHEKNLEKAKVYYLYGAMYKNGQGEYGRLQAASALLFKSSSALENAMGLYILKDFSDRDDVEKIVEPKYAGDYTRRGSARYLLAIYFAQQGDYISAKSYLEKALQDNQGQAAFALIYLNEAKKFPEPMAKEVVSEYMKVGEEKQRKYFYWGVENYSCWLERQADENREDIPFPVDFKLLEQLLVKHNACSPSQKAG